MADFLNHVAITAPRNGTTTHTVNPSTGTVASGSTFTPTAGRLLIATMQGGVTATTPTGWTLPTNGSAVNNGGLYVWWKVAAGSDTLVTTHNGSDYLAVFDFYEFPSTSAFVKAASAVSVATNGAGPTLSALTGTNWIAGAAGYNQTASGAQTWSWATGIEIVDTFGAQTTTDGVFYGLAALDSSVLTSTAFTATSSLSAGPTVERLMFAVSVTAGAPAATPPILTMPAMRR